jgi:hypothetical protein
MSAWISVDRPHDGAKRKRPMVTLTLAPDTLEALDRERGHFSRGVFVDHLLKLAVHLRDHLQRTIKAALKKARGEDQ